MTLSVSPASSSHGRNRQRTSSPAAVSGESDGLFYGGGLELLTDQFFGALAVAAALAAEKMFEMVGEGAQVDPGRDRHVVLEVVVSVGSLGEVVEVQERILEVAGLAGAGDRGHRIQVREIDDLRPVSTRTSGRGRDDRHHRRRPCGSSAGCSPAPVAGCSAAAYRR